MSGKALTIIKAYVYNKKEANINILEWFEMRIDRVRLAAEMAKREWRDYHVAKLAGISRSTMSAVRGGKSIKTETAGKIAIALNLPVEQLVEKGKV